MVDRVCSRHNGVSSSLLCARCGDTICPKCMTVSPVGYRCPDCSKLIKIPTYNLSKKLLVKVLVIAVFCGLLIGGILFVFVLSLRASSLPAYLNYYLFMASIAISGFFIGETVSLTSNRRRGRTLKYISSIGVLTSIGFLLATNVIGIGIFTNFNMLIALAIALYLASIRV
mgnify:FL=1